MSQIIFLATGFLFQVLHWLYACVNARAVCEHGDSLIHTSSYIVDLLEAQTSLWPTEAVAENPIELLPVEDETFEMQQL